MIKHRGETRGLGGIFFDDQNDKGKPITRTARRRPPEAVFVPS